ncbi:hypothetical protein NEAUS05_2444 [Nematocida ausubeli]|nr:hypothetical protein NEAUS07_2412 [Nematocida ausubeli]KAI5151229.1 hypothetical protein NEAUS05_2444 [Nematocida ausubeli]
MSESNISKRQNQLEAESNTASNQHEDRMHSESIGKTIELAQKALKALPLKKGSKMSKMKLGMMDMGIPRWPSLAPGLKIFTIYEELSSRSETEEKRIFTQFESHITRVGTPLKDWTNEHYEKAITVLHGLIDSEQLSPLVDPPRKGNGTWAEWVDRFVPYIIYGDYTWEEVETEFLRKFTEYPTGFLVIWRTHSQELNKSFKTLYRAAQRIDEFSKPGEDSQKKELRNKKDTSKMSCRKCGTIGHIARNCWKKNNNSSGNDNFGKYDSKKRKFDGFNNFKKKFHS